MNYYAGNQALIQQGTVPIDEGWDGNISSLPLSGGEAEQISLFP